MGFEMASIPLICTLLAGNVLLPRHNCHGRWEIQSSCLLRKKSWCDKHKRCPTDVDWTQHVISAHGLTAMCENEAHTQVSSSAIPVT